MTDWNMRTEDLELKDGSIINNYHYEFNTTNSVFAKIVEDVLRAVIDIAREKLAKQTESSCTTCKHDAEPWYSELCDGCTRADSNYEPMPFISGTQIGEPKPMPKSYTTWATAEPMTYEDWHGFDEWKEDNEYEPTTEDCSMVDGMREATKEERASVRRWIEENQLTDCPWK